MRERSQRRAPRRTFHSDSHLPIAPRSGSHRGDIESKLRYHNVIHTLGSDLRITPEMTSSSEVGSDVQLTKTGFS